MSEQRPDDGAQPRIEHDLLGEREIPAGAYYGIQAARAPESFHITGVSIFQNPGLAQPVHGVVAKPPGNDDDIGGFGDDSSRVSS